MPRTRHGFDEVGVDGIRKAWEGIERAECLFMVNGFGPLVCNLQAPDAIATSARERLREPRRTDGRARDSQRRQSRDG